MLMFADYYMIILLVFVPTLELRAAVPYGILATNLSDSTVVIVALAANVLLGPLVYIILGLIWKQFNRYNWFNRIWLKYGEKARCKLEPYTEKYGLFGISLFIGVPLPGSGSYTGALGAFLLGMSLKQFAVANFIGCFIATLLVWAAVRSGVAAFSFLFTIPAI